MESPNNTYTVSDGEYYKLLAARRAIATAKLVLELSQRELNDAVQVEASIHAGLIQSITENGKYSIDNLQISETDRIVNRLPVT